MEPVICNVNSSMLMGKICSDIRSYETSAAGKTVEFDLEIENFNPKRNIIRITCVSTGTQAELISRMKKKGNIITVLGYIGDVDTGQGVAAYGNHKFRVTSVKFKSGSLTIFGGIIITQPSDTKSKDGKDRIEFFIGSFKRHETMPLHPVKLKVICEGSSYKVMKAFLGIKNVHDGISVIGYLSEENGSLCVVAKKIDPLLPEKEKNRILREASRNENANGDKRDNNQGRKDNSKSGDDAKA